MRKLRQAVRCVVAGLLSLVVFFGAMLASYALYADIHWPGLVGDQVESRGGLTLDISNAAAGYVMARGEESNKRLKLRVSKGGSTLTYDINTSGDYETIPLQMGSGSYDFELFRNVEGKKYAADGSVSFEVELINEYASFLLPNQYVPYNQDSEAVRISDEICAGLETDEQKLEAVRISDEICAGLETDAEKLEAVRNYVVNNFSYDFNKAATIKSGTLPSIDELLQNRAGICQDIAAFTACVLRVQGIPTQMVIGQANRYYHAWNNVLIDGEFRRIDLTAEINSIYEGVSYTPERYY